MPTPARIISLTAIAVLGVVLCTSIPAAAADDDDAPLVWIAYEPGRLLGIDPMAMRSRDHVDGASGRLRVAVSADGSTLYTAGLSGLTRLDRTARNARVASFLPAEIAVPLDLALSPDGTEIWLLGLGAAGRKTEIVVIADDGIFETVETVVSDPLGRLPGQMAFSPDGETLWVSLLSERELVGIDVATRTERIRVDLGSNVLPETIAIGPIGILYVADRTGAVTFVDAASGVVLSSVLVGRPAGLAVNAGGGILYVTDSESHRLLALDALTGEQLAVARMRGKCSAPGPFVMIEDDTAAIIACTGSNNVVRVKTAKMTAGRTLAVPGAQLSGIATGS